MSSGDYKALKDAIATRLNVLIDEQGNFRQKNQQPLEESQAREALELLTQATKIWGTTARSKGGSKSKAFEEATRYITGRPTAGEQSSGEQRPTVKVVDGKAYGLQPDGTYKAADGTVLPQ